MAKNFQKMQSLPEKIPHLNLILSSILLYQRMPMICESPKMLNLILKDHPQFELSTETKSLILSQLFNNFELQVIEENIDPKEHILSWMKVAAASKETSDDEVCAILFAISKIFKLCPLNTQLKKDLWLVAQ